MGPDAGYHLPLSMRNALHRGELDASHIFLFFALPSARYL